MDQLGLDLKQIIAQLINFVLFFIIFKKFIAASFSRFLDAERRKEKESEEALAKIKAEEENLAVKKIQLNEEMKKQMEKAMKEAEKQAALIKNEIITDARKEAEEIKKKSRKQLEEEHEKLNLSVKKRMADLSIAIVDKAFRNYLDEATKKNITKYILNNLTKDVVYL